MNWKILSIILIVILVLENAFIGWGYYLVAKEEQQIKECYYEVCEAYPQAWIDSGICYCYQEDMTGELIVAKTTLMD